MAHCHSVHVEINGRNVEICTVVPGNEDIHRDLKEGKEPKVTREHVDRAVDHYLKHQHDEDKKVRENPSRQDPKHPSQRPDTMLKGERRK